MAGVAQSDSRSYCQGELVSLYTDGCMMQRLSYEGTDHQRLSEKQYEAVCNATTIVTQRALMGANLINFQAHKIYTINGGKQQNYFKKSAFNT